MHALHDRGRTLPPDLLVDRMVFESPVVSMAIFRAGVGHVDFTRMEEIPVHLFAFPRNAVRIAVEGRQPYIADPRTVAFYNAGDVFRRDPVDLAGDICDIFVVRADAMIDVIAHRDPAVRDRQDVPFPFTHGPSRPEAFALQRQMLRHVESTSSPDRLAMEEGALRLLASIAGSVYERLEQGLRERPVMPSEAELGEAVRAHVVERYRLNESLEDIAAAVDRSVYYICRVFRRYTGTTIHRYRHQLRLRRSLDLVAESSSDLSRVAFQLGFSSHSHFTAAFREAFGIPPSEFRCRPSTRRLRELAERVGAA